MDIILIAAVTIDGYIARHSHEKIHWSQDLDLFKEQTIGHPVIMGSHTFESLQNKLIDRQNIIVHRNDDPVDVLKKINAEKCFVAGGGRTNSKFIDYLTHLYITPHPYVFGGGIKLFHMEEKEFQLELINTYEVKIGIIQYQYKVIG